MGSMSRSFSPPRGETLQSVRRRIARWVVRMSFGRGRNVPNAGPLPAAGIHRILICHVSHTLGNTLLLTPLLRELERAYPGAEVDLLTRSPVADDVFGSFRCVRHVFRLPRHGMGAPWRVLRILRTLRTHQYDLAIDPCVSSQSDRIGVLAARATRRLGYVAPGKSGRLSHGVAVPTDVRHVGQLPVYLLRSATGRGVQDQYPSLDVCLTPSERAFGAALLAGLVTTPVAPTPPLIGLFANATGTKQLGATWWQRFARRVAERVPGSCVVEIVPVSGTAVLGEGFPTFYSSDLRRLACALSGLSLFVSADCGIMHLACASGTPTVGLFTVTDAKQWGPYGVNDCAFEVALQTPEQVADALALPSGS